MWEPFAAARNMNSGFPPTLRNARTGELTPPGMVAHALRNSFFRFGMLMVIRLYYYT